MLIKTFFKLFYNGFIVCFSFTRVDVLQQRTSWRQAHQNGESCSVVTESNRDRSKQWCCLVSYWKVWIFTITFLSGLSGSWVPEISRSFHYWQPAPRLRPLPWQANPGKPAMSPQALEGGQAPITLINSGKRKGGEGRGKNRSFLVPKTTTHVNVWICLHSENDKCSVSTWNYFVHVCT